MAKTKMNAVLLIYTSSAYHVMQCYAKIATEVDEFLSKRLR